MQRELFITPKPDSDVWVKPGVEIIQRLMIYPSSIGNLLSVYDSDARRALRLTSEQVSELHDYLGAFLSDGETV